MISRWRPWQDRVYVFQRKDRRVVVFDRDGRYLGAWAAARYRPHDLKIVGTWSIPPTRSTRREVVTLAAAPHELGTRGVHSERAAKGPLLAEVGGPFNHPTEMMAHPTANLRDGRLPQRRVHRLRGDGRLVTRGARGQGRASSPAHSIRVRR